jgi:ParB-like chromosome segregation protein Spo0J
MINQTQELSKIDTRYESFHLPDKRREKDLLNSICESGIKDPLQGVWKDQIFILLDGFKRLRAARKLRVESIPITELGASEKEGLIELLKISNAKSLHLLEQVMMINDLHQSHFMTVRDIAAHLEKSVSWVNSRIGILKDLGQETWLAVFKGDFPASNAIYTLRQYKRLNKVSKEDIDEFVKVVSGKGLTHRQIEALANGWFKGGKKVRDQIKNGDLTWPIKQLDEKVKSDLGENERRLINDLEITGKYMGRIISKSFLMKEFSPQFKQMAKYLAAGIVEKQKKFSDSLQNLTKGHDD